MSNSLVHKLFKTLLNGAGVPPGTQVVLESPTRPVDTAKLAELEKANGVGEAAEALELFSRLIDDDMPLLSHEWRGSGIRLGEVYEQILQATPNGPIQDRKFAEARQLFETLTLASVIQPGLKFQPSWPNPVGWAGPNQQWSRLQIEGQDIPDRTGPSMDPDFGKRNDPWPDIAKLFDDPDDKPVDLDEPRWPFPRIARRQDLGSWEVDEDGDDFLTDPLHDRFNLAEQLSRPGFGSDMPMFDPDNPRGNGPLGPNDNPLNPWPPRKPKPRPVLFPDEPLIIRPRIPPPPSPPPPPPKPAKLLEVEYLTVSISRRWLNALLLQFPGWSLPGFPAGYFSNGNETGNTGITPLLPVSFIAIRNLSISGVWTDAEADDLYSRLQGKGSSTFGPFTLSAFGQSLASFDGSTLEIPGTSILAWYCRLLPMLPPAAAG